MTQLEVVQSWGYNALSIASIDDKGVLAYLAEDPEALTRIWYENERQHYEIGTASDVSGS